MLQDDVITIIKAIIMALFADDPSALVFGPSVNLIYDSAVPGSFVVPDCCVILGVDAVRVRFDSRSYRIEEWGQRPAFVLEVGSPSTARRDLVEKRAIYAGMGAQEYWRLDRSGGDYYGEPLVGERLVNGEYERLELHTEPNGDIWSRSEVLGVDFYYRVDEDGYSEFSGAGQRYGRVAEYAGGRARGAAGSRSESARRRSGKTRSGSAQPGASGRGGAAATE